MKIIKILGYAILYLVLCLIVMPVIVKFLGVTLRLGSLAPMIGVFIKIMLALQISKRINTVTQIFPNYLRSRQIIYNKPNQAQTVSYLVYFSLIFLISKSLTILELSTNVAALIVATLIKLLITYIIANIVRHIVSQKPKNLIAQPT